MRKPVITIFFCIVCIAVFLGQISGLVNIYDFAIISEAVREGEWYRIITGSLMHADMVHIFSNLLAFVNIGTYCEENSKKSSYLLALLISMFTSGLAVTYLSNSVTVGFSGVVFGIFGYFAVLLYKDDGRLSENDQYIIARMIIPNIIISFMPGVSWQGHLGGFVGGLLAGLLFIR